MKFRCITNSIRIRLTKSDIAQIQNTEKLYDKICFPNNRTFMYGIRLVANDISVNYSEDIISIELNKSICNKWANSSAVSIEKVIDLPNEEKLYVLIEKDFPCKHSDSNSDDTFNELAT